MLYPVEILVLCSAIFCSILYCFLGVLLRAPIELYFSKLAIGLALYAVALLIALLISRLKDIKIYLQERKVKGTFSSPEDRHGKKTSPLTFKDSVRAFSNIHLKQNDIVFDLRMIHAVSLLFVVFIELKNLIPFVNRHNFDPEFAILDHLVCGGNLCSELLLKLLGPRVADFLSESYLLFFPYMATLLMVVLLYRGNNRKQIVDNFFLTFSIVWLLGIAFVYSLPSLGPYFFYPEKFLLLPDTEVKATQIDLWTQATFVINRPYDVRGVFLVSGFPSLHFAIPLLGAVNLRNISRSFRIISVLFTAVTAVSTLYFGWHYLIDLIGSILLVVTASIIAAAFKTEDKVLE